MVSSMGLIPVTRAPIIVPEPPSPVDEDAVVALIAKVARGRGLQEIEAFFLFHVLLVPPWKWLPLVELDVQESARRKAHL